MNSQLRQDTAWVIRVRWLARAPSVLSIGLLVLFIIGEGSGPHDIATRQWIGLLFFPFGVVVGMLVAWKREALGGLLSIGSLVCFTSGTASSSAAGCPENGRSLRSLRRRSCSY